MKRTALYADRSENVESTVCRREQHTLELRMPVQFLDFRLSLVNEQQLRWQILQLCIRSFVVVVSFDRQIPQGNLIIVSSGGQNGRLFRVPLDGCYVISMVLECGYGRFRLEVTQIPNVEEPVITT